MMSMFIAVISDPATMGCIGQRFYSANHVQW